MNESILNHLFLPHYLPSSVDHDYFLQNNHQHEHMILEYMKAYFNQLESTKETSELSIFSALVNCVKHWSSLQNPQTCADANLQSTIMKLTPGSFLPLYFHAQNAAILIEIEKNNAHQPLVSSWQVLLPIQEITSSLVPHFSCFPVTTYRLNDRSQLSSLAHCELLVDFMHNTIEYSKSYKASRQVNETRNLPESYYVCQWWIQQFEGIKIKSKSNRSIQFKKKHRDQIRWSDALLPFRRSGLWMTIKVVFHIILTKRLGSIGIIIYKLLITHFLTYCLSETRSEISTDVLVHCIRKIVRRLNKIEILLSSIDANDLNEWVQLTKHQIQMKINKVLPKPNWQKSIRIYEKSKYNVLMNNFDLNNSNIYQHLFQELKSSLKTQKLRETCQYFSPVTNYNDRYPLNSDDCIPSIKKFTGKFNYTIGIALTRIEIWVESRLNQWINRPAVSHSEKNRFETLLHLFEDYLSEAISHYYSIEDPIGYSRFILTSLTIIRSMNQKLCSDQRFERLKLHSIEIPNLMDLFKCLVLPNRDDMKRAHSLYCYFSEFRQKPYPDILTNIRCDNAFGVNFAAHSSTMKEILQKIRDQAELDKQDKIQEIIQAKQRYSCLMDLIKCLSCKGTYGSYPCICEICRIQKEANDIKVNIFESPLPSDCTDALAVIFELQMPIEIRCYRDIIWQFINRPKPNLNHQMYEWLSVPPHASKLGPFYTGPKNNKVKLLSSTKSITQTHYSSPSIAFASVSDFLYESSLKIQISPTSTIAIKDECLALTPQLDHPGFKQLQFTINNTQFVQNHVIAKLCQCSARVKPTQFVEFGSFRSGHRLQWWNLLAMLELDSLSIAEESVAILIIHSILQYGPLTMDGKPSDNSWCSEAHKQLLEDNFIDELAIRLDRRLDDCELNWQNELVLLVVTMITMRMLTICNSKREEKVVNLAIKCRRIGEKWIDLISETIKFTSSPDFNEIENLRLKMVTIGISCILTFSIHSDRIHCLLSSNEDVMSLLKAATTTHDNIILNKIQSNISTFATNIMRFSERTLVMVQPIVAEFLQKTSFKSLNDFSAIYWAVIRSKGTMNGQWQKRTEDVYDGWYDCQYDSRYISINCIKGTFLVDGMTIGFLPESITTNELFVRVFEEHIFEVQLAESPKTYITRLPYGNGQVQYEFHLNDETKHLTITERHITTNEIFQLIPHSHFQAELPDVFVSNHSHWLNKRSRIVEFRPIHFKEANFLDHKPYVLSLTTGYVVTNDMANEQRLVNQSSPLFDTLFNQYFVRLDSKPYVYMMGEHISQSDIIIHIHLSRLGIAFKYNGTTKIITSREYSDMCIDQDQWLGTLTGLTSSLLLSPLSVKHYRLEHYPYRKLIVPFGTILSTRGQRETHQTVTIDRPSSMSFSHQYFVFTLNDRLKILQSTDSPTGWLYLALLHATTSHPLPDHYTGMTGMERAFQLLYSAGCWSDQPFNELSLYILGRIGSISPKVNYYPEHLTCMEKIDWNSNGIPYSMQHFGYYLIAKQLIDSSQLFNFMYPSLKTNKIPEVFQVKIYNEMLLKKLYWDYRDSYNPAARLSAEMEKDILRASSTKLYRQTLKNCSNITNYSAVRLVDDLYKNGNVNLTSCSMQNWLPLSQWLTKGSQLKTLWVGLLQLADRFKREAAGKITDDIQRFECLLKFLHYISDRCQIKPYYLQMLKTTLNVSKISFASLAFPPFVSYTNIEQIPIVKTLIPRGECCDLCQNTLSIAELERCWRENCEYPNVDGIATSTEKYANNKLLKSPGSNLKLRLFLECVQSLICSVPIKQFDIKVTCSAQNFVIESLKDHYQIQMKITNKTIEPALLRSAEHKFHQFNTYSFNQPTKSIRKTNRQKKFPQEIFPSINNKNNPPTEITNYFKKQLSESWKKLLSDDEDEKENPAIEEITEALDLFRHESTRLYNEFSKSITLSNEQLFEAGLLFRITPTVLIPLLLEKDLNPENVSSFKLTNNQYTILGGIIVNWTFEQQMERTLHFATHNKREDFRNEVSHIPHSNWKPSEHIPWLVLELEMNITIREIQIKVANHMMQPNMRVDNSTVQNIVTQMNMGEGKTAVILPMLAAYLSSSNLSLARIIVLKSLFPTNYQSLRYKLGGLLNRRIFPFACRRDMNFKDQQINQIFERFKHGLRNCDIILTTSEDILSFDLLTIDKCRRHQFDVGRSMLTVQRWLKTYVRDVLDESDEILHVKYQLIYTVGGQQQLDAGEERWKTIQSILNLVKKHAKDVSRMFQEKTCYKSPERKSGFPQFRLQSCEEAYPLLCQKIASDWIDSRNYRSADKATISSFILETSSSVENLIDKFPPLDIQLFLIVRGLLSSEVLLVAFKKRYRVNYGVNPNISFNRLMAVPFRAKDVVVDRTEFGHPDVALVLTHLSYYYSGLNDLQLSLCFNRLNDEETDPGFIYDQWVLYEGEDNVTQSIKKWSGVNLQDYRQLTECLFPIFRYNMLVIHYFLNHFVVAREAKQFPEKLVASAWDLSSPLRSKIITGFSGTNDTQLLLPVHIRQYDLPELQKTDAIVVNNLVQPENENYQSLLINATSENILKQIISYKETINVILDVGALFIDGTNREIAMKWLNLSDRNQIDYAVYFDCDSIVVGDRQSHNCSFVTSPASERLDRCIFYLDEIHTRGTDFKFPVGFKAAVTLGNGLTKDRFVQACMRMRKLGNGHSLTFWSSYEVHQQIETLKRNSLTIEHKRRKDDEPINLIDILRWVYENTQQATWDGLHHWAAQSLNFQRKVSAFQHINWNDNQQQFTNSIMRDLPKECCEPEIIELTNMYGAAKELQTLFEIYHKRYEHTHHHLSKETKDAVLKRLRDYGGTKQRLSQLLDEEKQRELEHALEEERQKELPPSVKPCEPILHEEITRLCDMHNDIMDLTQFPNVFRRLPYAFTGTTFLEECQSENWSKNIWISTEFQRVIETKGESLNPFLRPPRWILVYRNKHLIFLSALEANWLLGRLNFLFHKQRCISPSTTTLRLLLPRIKRDQSIFVNTPTLTIPSLLKHPNGVIPFVIPLEWLVQLFIFNGTLYFETVDEQTQYCRCLSLCPKPRTKQEEEAFEKGWIAIDGFVRNTEHRRQLKLVKVQFPLNLLPFVKQMIENRNNLHAPISSHIGSIIFNSLKLI
ncbi:unnamed protein product [Rotaria socialis]|uniref:ubiquitinyl hydrolase 1 n=1 Tax=Rotaria socialis TaxID=392032 RepID=A0A818EQ24_9BILA|nr:unnamed protein product [Rotaria socialis]